MGGLEKLMDDSVFILIIYFIISLFILFVSSFIGLKLIELAERIKNKNKNKNKKGM